MSNVLGSWAGQHRAAQRAVNIPSCPFSGAGQGEPQRACSKPDAGLGGPRGRVQPAQPPRPGQPPAATSRPAGGFGKLPSKWRTATQRSDLPAAARAEEAVLPRRRGRAAARGERRGGPGRNGGGAGSGRCRPKMAEYVQVLKRALKHLGGHGGVRGALWQLLR